jgi:antitoxin FitA
LGHFLVAEVVRAINQPNAPALATPGEVSTKPFVSPFPNHGRRPPVVACGLFTLLSLLSFEGTRFVAQLIVRNIDEDLVLRLKRRAAEHGRSAEEEHRCLLRAALRSDGLSERLLEIPQVGEDSDFERAPELPREVDL